MSWCFWFPPPGYVKNGIRDEALIESIMIKREEEKKETRPGTVEKPKLRSMVIRNGIKTRGAKMLKKTVSIILEALSGSGCLLKGIKIPKCYAAMSSLALPQERLMRHLFKRHMSMFLDQAENWKNIQNVAHNAQASLPSNLCRSCSPTLALQFKNLVEDWFVPTLQSELTSFGDEDWLFQKKQNLNSEIKSSKDGNVSLCQMNSTSCPHARFLPEADLYALPFTVPF
ncbi:hypothetical protein HRI_003824400 [Hibiscus trionum]|uniref:Uncharacterized protein n=1 Tax=Hibiscus trionum TaxID=183268 RepID=A0A9W7MF03_HIBTR|nr:hypothetical protein HRI_003824400 [Hibiscus trionum]